MANVEGCSGPPVLLLKAQTSSSDRTTGMQPKFSTSYMRLDEGESPIGTGQNTAERKPHSRSS